MIPRRVLLGGFLTVVGLGSPKVAEDRWYRLVLRTASGDTILYTWQRPVPMAEVLAFRDEIRNSLAWQHVSGPDAVIIVEETPVPKWRAISRERLGHEDNVV